MALYIIILLTFLVHVGFAGSRLVVPLFAVSQGASPFVVGTVVSVYAALPALLALPAGRLLDRLGFKTPLVFGTGGVLFALLLPFIWPSLPVLYVTVCVLGVSFMFFQLATQTLAGAIAAPSERSRNFSWVSLGFASANFTGPLLSGFLIDQIGHARTFAAIAMPLIPATLFALAGSRWIPDVHTPTEKSAGSAFDLLRIKNLRDTLIASGIVSAAWDLYQFFMPLYGHAQGLSATAIGTVMSAFATSIVIVRLILPWGVKRTGEIRMLMYAMFVACAAYALFPFSRVRGPSLRSRSCWESAAAAGSRCRSRSFTTRRRKGASARRTACASPSTRSCTSRYPSFSAPSAPWQASRPCS